jgi:hypothetical protein
MLNTRNAAIIAITSASLSLLAMSVAQAQGSEKMKMPTNRAIYNTTRDPSTINRQTPRLDGTFHSFPTWPEVSGGVG